MTSTLGRPKGISVRRLQRIEEQVAPLVARGCTFREVADIVGISASQAAKDCAIIKERWNAGIDERLEIARGELVAKHDEIYKIAMKGYFTTKNTRMLEIASKELECLGRLLGQAGPSINLHNHQHNVAVTSDAVAALFQPLDAGAYAEMVQARPLPPAEDAAELEPIEVEVEEAGRDEWNRGTSDAAPSVGAEPEPDEPGAPKNRRISHPMR